MTYDQLFQRYKKKHGKLVEPRRGFDSLHSSLWLAYSMGSKRNFTDLGTYVNKPGDHGGEPQGNPPAYAFDLGRKNRFFFKGWNYLVARRLAKFYVENYKALNIEYVILGRRIWSRWGAKQKRWDAENGWHPLTTGDTSHDFHIHVEGHR